MAQSLTPLIFLPGMMCDARLFGPQIANLSADREILVAPITGHETVQALAAEILQNAPPTFALAGLSMGGIVAMEVIAQAPDRVDKLALIDTNPRAELFAVAAKRAARAQLAAALAAAHFPGSSAPAPTSPVRPRAVAPLASPSA